jgi:hypothetical protein
LFERDPEQGGFGENDGFKGRLLDLAGEKQGYRAVVVLIIGVVMDEFVQAWTDDQDRSPLEQRSQKQGDNLPTDGGGGILMSARRFGIWFSVHERLERLGQQRGQEVEEESSRGSLNIAS